MERTGRLIGIALAVIALDGCRGPQATSANASPTPSPTPARTGMHGGGGSFVAGAAAGVLMGRSAQNGRRSDPAPPPRPGGGFWRGIFGFGESGAHGFGG